MKRYMKKLAAAFMALAMLFSLSVTSFAIDSTVTSQGSRPADVTSFVVPTYVDNDFNVIFDSYGLIAETDAMRYLHPSINNGAGVDYDKGANFYFKNATPTVADKTAALTGNFVNSGDETKNLDAGTKLVVYAPLDSSATVTTIYAKVDAADKFEKWQKENSSAAADVADGDWAATAPFEAIADMKALNPLTGKGLDKIDELNEKHPTLYFQKGTKISDNSSAFNGMIPYTFVASSAYATTGLIYAYITTDDAGTETIRVFNALTGAANTELTAGSSSGNYEASDFDAADPADTDAVVQNAFITVKGSNNNDVVYYRQRTYSNVVSLNTTSSPLKVINKTNSTLGVTMAATLTNITGGDGKVVSGKQTYVYAKDMVSVGSGGTIASGDAITGYKFYDGPHDDPTSKEIVGGDVGVPVIYMELSSDQGDKEVMAYDSTAKNASMSISTTLAPVEGAYAMVWTAETEGGTATPDSGKYAYDYANDDLRERDFASVTFNLKGGIDAENKLWASIPASGDTAPKLTITWTAQTFEDLLPPSLTAATWVARKAWVFTSDKNVDNAALKQVTFVYDSADSTKDKTIDGSEVTYAKNTRVTPNTETFTIPVAFMTANAAKPQSVVFTFYDAAKPFRTVDVTITP